MDSSGYVICTNCQTIQVALNRFCSLCGTEIGRPFEAHAEHIDRRNKRINASVLFTDIVDLPTIISDLKAGDIEILLDVFMQYNLRIAHSYNGSVQEIHGDGIVLTFAGDEHSAVAAVNAGYDLIRAFKDLRPIKGKQLDIRVGIATGEILFLQPNQEDSLPSQKILGSPVHIASRLQNAAKPNTILVSATTNDCLRGYFNTQKIDYGPLKGFDKEETWQVVDRNIADIRFDYSPRRLTPLIGRNKQLKTLSRAWANSKQKKGQVVFLSGDAGVGKSRIIAELQRSISRYSEPHIILKYQCSQFATHQPLFPVIQQFIQAANIKPSDSAAVTLEKLEVLLDKWNVDTAYYCAKLAPLLVGSLQESLNTGDHTDKQIEEALRACTVLPMMFTVRSPVIVIIEDMHWADETSKRLLANSLKRVNKRRMLIVVTARPEYLTPKDNAFIETLHLQSLSDKLAERLIRQLQDLDTLPPETVERIIEVANGNPLILEEIALNTLQQHALQEEGQEISVPLKLVDSFLGRFSLLSPPAKRFVQLASVMPYHFDIRMLHGLTELSENELNACIDELVSKEIMYNIDKGSHFYHIKHILLHDAIYNTLLNSEKYELHAQLLEQMQLPGARMTTYATQNIEYHVKNMDKYADYV